MRSQRSLKWVGSQPTLLLLRVNAGNNVGCVTPPISVTSVTSHNPTYPFLFGEFFYYHLFALFFASKKIRDNNNNYYAIVVL